MLGRGRQAKRLFPVNGYPAAGADETRVVQPYWSDKLKNFPDKHLAVVLKDTHRSVSFGTRKPDVVGYLANKPRSIFHIALVGDVKARRQENKAVFDASEKGQMESFLEDLLLEFQPYRQAVNGFLTDGCLIQFFRLEKLEASTSACELQWTEGPVHFLHDEGDKWLLGLLRNRNAHGLPEDIVINEEPVVVDQLLGVGGSSVVYSGTHQGTILSSFLLLRSPLFFVTLTSFFHILTGANNRHPSGGEAILFGRQIGPPSTRSRHFGQDQEHGAPCTPSDCLRRAEPRASASACRASVRLQGVAPYSACGSCGSPSNLLSLSL